MTKNVKKTGFLGCKQGTSAGGHVAYVERPERHSRHARAWDPPKAPKAKVDRRLQANRRGPGDYKDFAQTIKLYQEIFGLR
jgi:hypothetical protein